MLGSAEEQTVCPSCHLALGLAWEMDLSTNRLQSVVGDGRFKGGSTGDGRMKMEGQALENGQARHELSGLRGFQAGE